MNKLITILLVLAAFVPAHAQSFEAQQLILDWQKLGEEKQILKDLYADYQILSKGYGVVRDLSKGSFDLHKAFLDGLLIVSPAVKNYQRVADIIRLQENIVAEYSQAWSRVRQDPHFTATELGFIGNVYAGLFDQSVKNLSALTALLTDGVFRAGDGERLGQMDTIYREMAQSQVFITSFNNRTALLSLQRSADANDYQRVRQLYGLNL